MLTHSDSALRPKRSNLQLATACALVLASSMLSGCGITSRVVEETAVGGAPSSSGGSSGGASMLAGGGGQASGGSSGGSAATAGMASGGAPVGVAGMGGSCLPGPNPTLVHALSAWEYGRAVQGLTGNAVSQPLPSAPSLGVPFTVPLSLDEATVQALFDEANAQAASSALNLEPFLPCPPEQASDCAGSFVDAFVGSAFRRPLTASERERYIGLFLQSDGDAALGFSLVVRAALMSPLFLYKSYLGDSASPNLGASSLTPFELAARVSFLLAGSPPELGGELWQAAEAQRSLDASTLQSQANQLMTSDAFVESAVHFNTTWLGLDQLAVVRSELDAGLLGSAATQSELFLAEVFRGDRRLSSLLLSRETFVDARLAQLYGLVPVADFSKVTLDATEASGVLTLTSSLLRFANPTQRGQFVRERLLCQAVPPPPPGSLQAVEVPPTQTRRQAWVEQVSREPTCASCHALLDPVGFGFEHFGADAVYRITENDLSVDDSGQLDDQPFKHLDELAHLLVADERVADCVGKSWLSYALERPLTDNDACTVREVSDAFARSQLNFGALLSAIVASTPFRTREAYVVPGLAPPPALSAPSGAAPSGPARDKLLLDFSVGEALWFAQIVPPEDRPELERYLDALRSLETRLGQTAGPVLPAP